jgi:hypothetical protein
MLILFAERLSESVLISKRDAQAIVAALFAKPQTQAAA